MSMITLKELNKHNYPTDEETSNNLATLLERINKVRAAYGKPMIVTSGLRSQADQQRINPKAPKSNHLKGLAVDIADPKGELAAWTKKNLKLMEEIGLWMEDFEHTKGWLHYQCVPPKSGKRVFKP